MAGIIKFVMAAAIAALLATGGTAWAAEVPPPCNLLSPNFTPDFANNQSCLSLNASPNNVPGYPGFYSPAGLGDIAPFSNGNPEAPPAGVTTVLRLTPNSNFQTSSAWFNTPQTVAGAFSTTFRFQLSRTTTYVADGIAFLIQNSGTSALDAVDSGSDGCSLGFGQITSGTCTATTGGIPKSLAFEFDTYENDDISDPNANHVSVQSCGRNPNRVDASCRLADNSNLLDGNGNPVTLADGNIHTVTITFSPSGTCTNASCPGILDVILDNNDLFPAVGGDNPRPEGVPFDIASIGLTNGTAYLGFTGATGGGNDLQDILSWTFQPGSQSSAVNTVTPALLSFNGGTQNNAYDYNALLTSGGLTSATVSINPVLMNQNSCNKLVQKSFPPAQCFVYQNAGTVNGQSVDAAVLFEVTCPDQEEGTCGSPDTPDFFATLGSDFTFLFSENVGFRLLAATIGPYPGWLKGAGPDALHPCTPYPNNWPPLFQSNQIESFSFSADPSGKTKGGSAGTGSCWAATFATPGELPPGISIAYPKFTTYAKNSVVTASYTCSTPATSKDVTNPANTTGPYLTVASCTQSQLPNKNNTPATCSSPMFVGGISCTGGGVDTSTAGLHAFSVTGVDSGGNVNINTVIYNVK